MDSCCSTDVALAGMNNEEVATRLRGRAGTSVTLKVRRAVNVSVLHQFPFSIFKGFRILNVRDKFSVCG